MSGPKICHISTVDISAGILLKNQMLYFKSKGIETHAMAAPGRYVEEIEAAGIRFHSVPMTRIISPVKDLNALHKMVTILREERFDLIHLHTPKAVLLGTLGGLLAGVPHIFRTIHGFYFNVNATPSAQLFFVNMERVVNRVHDTVFSQNSEDIVTAQAKGIRRSDQIIFLGNGIDLTRFAPENLPLEWTAQLRQAHGIEEGDIVLGFVGRFVIQKGMREFFEAFNRIAPTRPKLKLLLVGEVDHDKPDAVPPQSCIKPELLDRVIEVGWQTEVEAFYPLMDVFVLPSYREGFPRTPMEASALGIPVLATDIRGCREAVEDGVNGLLVESKDIDSLAEGLCRILDNPELRAQLGAGGRTKAASDFNEVEKFETVYSEYARIFGL
jgi:glycosyltransferase involved in cell wall biosynthesis